MGRPHPAEVSEQSRDRLTVWEEKRRDHLFSTTTSNPPILAPMSGAHVRGTAPSRTELEGGSQGGALSSGSHTHSWGELGYIVQYRLYTVYTH